MIARVRLWGRMIGAVAVAVEDGRDLSLIHI